MSYTRVVIKYTGRWEARNVKLLNKFKKQFTHIIIHTSNWLEGYCGTFSCLRIQRPRNVRRQWSVDIYLRTRAASCTPTRRKHLHVCLHHAWAADLGMSKRVAISRLCTWHQGGATEGSRTLLALDYHRNHICNPYKSGKLTKRIHKR